jgi:hypothetical protein
MTIDEALAKAVAYLDEMNGEEQRALIRKMIAEGRPDAEINRALDITTERYLCWRIEKIAQARAWLERGGETAH